MHFEVWQWVLIVLAAVLVGMTKTGIAGLGTLTIAIVANIIPGKIATGFVLPMLIVADVVAVVIYRQHAVWSHLLKLLPWTVLGVFLGTVALNHISDSSVRPLIGWIVLVMLALHVWRQFRRRHAKTDEDLVKDVPVWFPICAGLLAGITTQIANAAGPIMILYLLSMRLPKMEFVGTSAVFYCALNLFKAPFMVYLGMITWDSLMINAMLVPAVLIGTALGRWLVHRINQLWFERVTLVLTFVAAIKLVAS